METLKHKWTDFPYEMYQGDPLSTALVDVPGCEIPATLDVWIEGEFSGDFGCGVTLYLSDHVEVHMTDRLCLSLDSTKERAEELLDVLITKFRSA